MPRLNVEMYESILGLAQEHGLFGKDQPRADEYAVDDSFSLVRRRLAYTRFQRQVLARHRYQCAICGTQVREILDAAHISSYAEDKANRANPANGICLCKFCHAAFDRGLVAIALDGSLTISPDLEDEVAAAHFTRISAETRSAWLQGIESEFLLRRLNDFQEIHRL